MNISSNPSFKRYKELENQGYCLEDLIAIYDIACEKYFEAQKQYEEAEKALKKAMYNVTCYTRFHNIESHN